MKVTEEMRRRIEQFSRELAAELGFAAEEMGEEFGSPLEAVEVHGAELGDQVMREFTRCLLEQRAAPPDHEAACPDCGATGRLKRSRRRTLQTIRGEIEITEPECDCRSCRRSFFPDDGLDGRGA
jgi:hypothetical protein